MLHVTIITIPARLCKGYSGRPSPGTAALVSLWVLRPVPPILSSSISPPVPFFCDILAASSQYTLVTYHSPAHLLWPAIHHRNLSGSLSRCILPAKRSRFMTCKSLIVAFPFLLLLPQMLRATASPGRSVARRNPRGRRYMRQRCLQHSK